MNDLKSFIHIRYFDIHKPIYIEDKEGLRQSDPVTFQSQVLFPKFCVCLKYFYKRIIYVVLI